MKEIIYKSTQSEIIRDSNFSNVGYYTFKLIAINYNNSSVNLSLEVASVDLDGKVIKYFNRNYENYNTEILNNIYNFENKNFNTVLRKLNSDIFYSFLKMNNYYGFTEFEEIL